MSGAPLVLRVGHPIHVGSHTLTPVKLVGTGAYSTVWCCKDGRGGAKVAAKVTSVAEADARLRAEAEVQLLRAHPHRNIVGYIDHHLSTGRQKDCWQVVLVVEYSEQSLFSVMRTMSRASQRFSEAEVLAILNDVILALCHLHGLDPPVAHRDLKVENILIFKSAQSPPSAAVYKLCDMGSCTTVVHHPKNATERGVAEEDIEHNTTMLYRAPEMIDLFMKKRINEKADIWAFGVLTFYLMYFELPFEENRLQILSGKYRAPAPKRGVPSSYSSELLALLARCLTVDCDARPDAWDVAQLICSIRRAGAPPSR
eukprot:RCo017583